MILHTVVVGIKGENICLERWKCPIMFALSFYNMLFTVCVRDRERVTERNLVSIPNVQLENLYYSFEWVRIILSTKNLVEQGK